MFVNVKQRDAANIAAGRQLSTGKVPRTEVTTGNESPLVPPPAFIPSRQRDRKALLALYREATTRGLIRRVSEILKARYPSRRKRYSTAVVSEVFNYHLSETCVRIALLMEIGQRLPGLTLDDLRQWKPPRRKRVIPRDGRGA